ncbi:hypothetical protein D3C71_2116310 [compost metagenome]
MVGSDPRPEPIDRDEEQDQAEQVLRPAEWLLQCRAGGVIDQQLQSENRQQ